MKNAGVSVGIPDWGPLQADRGGRCKGTYLCRHFVHRAGRRHGARADDRHEYAAEAAAISSERSNTWIAPDSATPPAPPDARDGRSVQKGLRKLAAAWKPTRLRACRSEILPASILQNQISSARTCRILFARGLRLRHADVRRRQEDWKGRIACRPRMASARPSTPLVRGQIEGGVVMSMGYALREPVSD